MLNSTVQPIICNSISQLYLCTYFLLALVLCHSGLWFNSYAQALMAVPRLATLPSRPTESKANPQQVLESLFKIPEIRTYEPSSMDWKKVVKKVQSFNSPIESNNQERPKNGMHFFV